jgi:AraC-like DNA-binding protein
MSDIVKAREILESIIKDQCSDEDTVYRIRKALRLMYRAPCIRRAPGRRKAISRNLRREIRRLAARTEMTMQEIANQVGLGSSGRISEVLHHKR